MQQHAVLVLLIATAGLFAVAWHTSFIHPRHFQMQAATEFSLPHKDSLLRKAGPFRALPGSVTTAVSTCGGTSSSTYPYIGNDLFMDFCHHVYKPGMDLSGLQGPSMLFLHPRHVHEFGNAVQSLSQNVVLVSNSNVDECLPYGSSTLEAHLKPSYTAILNSSRVISWYGPNMVMDHSKLKHIPLGNKWQWQIPQHHAEDQNKPYVLQVLKKWASNPEANFKLDKPNLLLVKLSEGTSDGATFAPSRGRRREAVKAASSILQQERVVLQAMNASARACDKYTGFDYVQKFEEYLFEMRQYKYVLSPVGNGVDTHRFLEALLAGSIPVVESSVRDAMYDGLPVLIVPSWANLTRELLLENYERIKRRSYQWERLFAPYYMQRIIDDLLGAY